MRIHPVPAGLVVLLLIAAAALCWWVMSDGPGGIPVVEPAQHSDPAIQRIESKLVALSDRLDRIEATEAPLEETDRRPVEPVHTLSEDIEYLRSRMEEYERALASLELSIHQGGMDEIPAGYSAEVLKKLIKDLRGMDLDWKKQRRQRRIALSERLLREYPSDPEAGTMLNNLINDYIGEGRLDKAREALEGFAPLIRYEDWRKNSCSANLYSLQRDFDKARQAYDLNIHSSNISEGQRATSIFFHAHTYMKEGRYREARPLFQALIDRYGENPPAEVKDSVNGARTQLEKIEDYLKR